VSEREREMYVYVYVYIVYINIRAKIYMHPQDLITKQVQTWAFGSRKTENKIAAQPSTSQGV
jgi:hypothetical protein